MMLTMTLTTTTIIIVFSGMKIKLSKNNDHDRVSHGIKCRQESDRIPPLKSNV